MILHIRKPYQVFVNGILAQCTQTRSKAIKIAMNYFPSYVVDTSNGGNAVIWTGAK